DHLPELIHQPVEKDPRLGLALRTEDADTEPDTSAAARERPAVAAGGNVVAEPEHRLLMVVAGRAQFDLHADRAAVVGGTQTRAAGKKTGVTAGVDDDVRGQVVQAAERVADANSARARTPMACEPGQSRRREGARAGPAAVGGAGGQPRTTTESAAPGPG